LNSLEQARIDGELGIGKGSEGIGVVSSPSPSIKKRSKGFKKLAAATLAGGVFGGIGLAFLIEMFLDHSVRRPVQIETKLGLPLFISIPDMSRNGHRRLAKTSSSSALLLRNSELEPVTVENNLSLAKSEAAEVAPWDHRHALHRFYEGLRDRLLIYFEVRNLTHKPKLVAVTSCGRGAGVSSTAAGLAASLSETGDGNVLLVNMNSEQGGAQQFHKGQPGCPLDDALENETMSNALVKGKLYAATERLDEKLPRALPKSFAYLMPKLKASDYDYIIFDMPPVTQTSMTPRIAGLMDMVLLVIESEKTSQDVVKRVKALLGESKANVSTVLNKTRNYIPAQLHQEFLNDEV
jgi:Mrp family chromosome partitioning ATPase